MERGAICRRWGSRAEEKVGDLCSKELVQNWMTWCHLPSAALETCGLLYSLSYLYTSCKPPIGPQSCPDDKSQGRSWREMLTRDQEAVSEMEGPLGRCILLQTCAISPISRKRTHATLKNLGRWNNPELILYSCLTGLKEPTANSSTALDARGHTPELDSRAANFFITCVALLLSTHSYKATLPVLPALCGVGGGLQPPDPRYTPRRAFSGRRKP